MAALFPMMMNLHFVALAMVRLSGGRSDNAERRGGESKGDGNFLHGVFHKCKAEKK